MGLLDLLKNLFKGKSATELLEDAQETLQDGSLDGILEKVGVDSDKLESIVGGVGSAISMAGKVFGKDKEEAEESAEEETEEEESEDSEATE